MIRFVRAVLYGIERLLRVLAHAFKRVACGERKRAHDHRQKKQNADEQTSHGEILSTALPHLASIVTDGSTVVILHVFAIEILAQAAHGIGASNHGHG